MLLKNKSAVIYGAAGAVGGAVSRAFAREGARVFLAGRTRAPLEKLAREIETGGGTAAVGVVDALDEDAVERHLDGIVAATGGLDISFNLVSMGDPEEHPEGQGTPLVELPLADFLEPVTTWTRTQFLTARAAGRRMAARGRGVILMISTPTAVAGFPLVGGFGSACASGEALSRQLAAELGPDGVRVVCLRSAGSPDAPGVKRVWKLHADAAGMSLKEWTDKLASTATLQRMPALEEVANAAVLLASDRAAP